MGVHYWMVLLLIGLIGSVMQYSYGFQDFKPRPRWVYLILSVASSFSWFSLLVNLIIDYTNFLRYMTNRSQIFMGLTIVAGSNTFIDLFVNSVLSLQGFEIISITGIFAGQMFNFLFGFGLSCMIRYITSPDANYQFMTFGTLFQEKEQLMMFCVLLFSLVILLYLFLVFTLNG